MAKSTKTRKAAPRKARTWTMWAVITPWGAVRDTGDTKYEAVRLRYSTGDKVVRVRITEVVAPTRRGTPR